MSANAAHALSAIAFQLAAALEAYEQDIARLVRRPMDGDAYQGASRKMDQMRLYAASLPQVSVAWVEVLIRHFELTQALWRLRTIEEQAEGLDELFAVHHDAVRRLMGKCSQLMPRA